MNIVICGMKHCGKTTHGRFIAQRLNCAFLDTDELLEAKYFKLEKNPLNSREIFNLHGEDYFRTLEAEVIRELIATAAADVTRVIALGGGAPSNPKIGAELKQLGFFVFIDHTPEILYRRILKNGLPPFLRGENPREKFLRLYSERKRRYIELSDLTIEFREDTPVRSAGRLILTKIEEKIHERQHLR
ncbi:MAG: shikimate kinase [Victivallaceae bacterium]|nr:shikimate kinase [Victivallaceae bacterium]